MRYCKWVLFSQGKSTKLIFDRLNKIVNHIIYKYEMNCFGSDIYISLSDEIESQKVATTEL